MNRLEQLAIQVAIEAPTKLISKKVKIRADLVAEIRLELTRRGVDWGADHLKHLENVERKPLGQSLNT